MFKSNWGGWLVLASVIVFPSMLYLTRPASTDTIQKSESFSLNHAEVSAEQVEDKNQQLSSARVGHAVNDIDMAEESGIESNLNDMSDSSEEESMAPEREERYLKANQQFSQMQSYNSSESYKEVSVAEVSENRITRSNFSASINIQAESVTATTKSSSKTGQKQGNLNNIKASENAFLYLAEIQPPVQNNKSKCPPVYMELNGYARNMRAAMGCDNE